MSNFPVVVIVHAGAGFHSKEKEKEYNRICRKACSRGFALLKEKRDAVEVVVQVIKILEDSELTNAGVGSNLNEDGNVEMDASIMTGNGLFGACAAVPNVKNPIVLAKKIMINSQRKLSLGRIPPLVLCGLGAKAFAERNGIECVQQEMLETKLTKTRHEMYKSKLAALEHDRMDTVGAICIDCYGKVAAGSSSGGIAMKHAGRIGEAAVYGAGAWCSVVGNSLTACSASGCGESIMLELLSKTCAEQCQESQEITVTVNDLISKMKKHDGQKQLAGVIVVKCTFSDGEASFEFCCGHSTRSMSIGYASDNRTDVFVSRNTKQKISSSGILDSIKFNPT